MTEMHVEESGQSEERDWRWIYLGVLLYTGLLILALALFSRGTS